MKKLFVLALLLIGTAAGIAIASDHNPAPKGWFMAGAAPEDYESGLDTKVRRSGSSSAFIRAKDDPSEFSTLMQMISSANYTGKRVKFSAWVKSADVEEWSGLWMRVDGGKEMLSFDNMQDRPIKGTTDWKLYEVVLDVPATSSGIFYGILIEGRGQVWIDDAKLEIVPSTTPVTGASMEEQMPIAPSNLNFED